ncbi:IGR protein motif-domain-containing protein [Lasiosphaeria miniovina]|uniref:Small ribosomal subunit protein mS41 n=1 Tax=Lasiosphaeria miniovina TaxID=1954250 RepID=A0AA40B488_9PEZI|nr:IGR protein motif-domain-containing protein [Lasiosphaeria miniovina]KAK0727284.1 IGR protein motif-domain-containing protein [Lasiosphaeria miniovina]
MARIFKPFGIPTALKQFLRPYSAAAAPAVITTPRLGKQAGTGGKTQDIKLPLIPRPIPLVPDVETFLTVIGRGLKQHASKFPTWEALFTLTTDQLRELGVEPPRSRKYLIRWRQRFREGKFGVGGDLKYVSNGAAELRVLELAPTPLLRKRYVVNIPPGKKIEEVLRGQMMRPLGYKVRGTRTIVGPYALPKKDGSRITVTEGMWEDRRGHKVDGGERRKAEVRFKRGVAERKARRERLGR